MELKVWVEGIQRIVCGVTEKTTCQDIVYALAHATGRTGRFTLIERWRNNERLLAPQEHPLQVMKKWGEYSYDVQFILQRSPLDPLKGVGTDPKGPPSQGIWKTPPGRLKPDIARLSPDSGQGSDPTGSDSSNFSSDAEKSKNQRPSHLPPSGFQPSGWPRPRFQSPSPDRPQDYGYSRGGYRGVGPPPPAYRPPPHPGRNPSPAEPPPYREPPPPPGSHARGGPIPTSPTQGRHVSASPSRGLPPPHPSYAPHSPTPPRNQHMGRPPHYSPPPHHREVRGHPKGPSPGRSIPSRVSGSPARGHSSPARNTWKNDDYGELQNLVSAQKTRIQSQHAEIIHCENELRYFAGSGGVDYLPSQLEAVLAEVRRLEEAASRNEEELSNFGGENQFTIRNELDQLKHRLEMTDLELQKTNATLRRLGDEMRSYSQEKMKERECELRLEIAKIEQEIKHLQRSSEDSTAISDKLNREQKDVEQELSNRKAEVEHLMKEMKSLNLESLTISPPEESKPFLEGPMKAGSTRKMLGSPRQLENAVPTSKNPHGVWV